MYLNNFRSQYFWGLNKCDTIINMSELNEFTNIIKKIKPNFNLIKMNKSNDISLKITKSEEIINFVNYTWQDLKNYDIPQNILMIFKNRLIRLSRSI